jgi:hypothetical protein
MPVALLEDEEEMSLLDTIKAIVVEDYKPVYCVSEGGLMAFRHHRGGGSSSSAGADILITFGVIALIVFAAIVVILIVS